MSDPEQFWNSLLSREPILIREAWNSLSLEEQQAILAHLVRMTTEEGWAEPQRISAGAALAVLQNPAPPDRPSAEKQ